MVETMDVLNAFGTPLKLAWAAWLAWGVGQYFWLRHERSKPTKKVSTVARPTAKKSSSPRRAPTAAAHAPAVGRSSTPPNVAAAHMTPAGIPTPVVPVAEMPPEPTAPMVSTPVEAPTHAFDPAMAIIEQFGASDDHPLDKFVRDFEMQDLSPQRRRAPVPNAPSYGAETPAAP